MSVTIRNPWALLWLALCLVAPPAAADREEALHEVDPDVEVEIEILQGNIEITGWARDDVRIRTRKGEIEGLEIEAERDWVSIRPRGGAAWFSSGGSVDLQIHVPRAARVDARTVNGRIRAEEVEGGLSLHTVNGAIDVKGAPREAYMETLSSSIDFRGENVRDDARIDARTISGSIEVRDVGNEVTASTMSGSIRVRDARLKRAEVTSMSGSIDLEAEIEEAARIMARTHTGSITLTVPRDTEARFDAMTRSGRIKNEFGADARERRGSHRLDFETGEGDARVTLENTRGSIKIRARD